jgi:hypothetical protein
MHPEKSFLSCSVAPAHRRIGASAHRRIGASAHRHDDEQTFESACVFRVSPFFAVPGQLEAPPGAPDIAQHRA